MTAKVTLDFGKQGVVGTTARMQLLAGLLGQEMEATLSPESVEQGVRHFTEQYAPDLWWERDRRGTLTGVTIDADDEPTVHALAAHLTHALHNTVGDLMITRALGRILFREAKDPERTDEDGKDVLYAQMRSHAPMVFPDIVDLKYVRDRNGLIWRVVRDGGMVATCDYSGKNWSMGIAALDISHGPLTPVEPDAFERGKALGMSNTGRDVAAAYQTGLKDAQRIDLDRFVQWVATQRAFNGADDFGQEFYDRGLNGVLRDWAREFIEEQA